MTMTPEQIVALNTLLNACEEAVRVLCEASQAPFDEFDKAAGALGCAADALAASAKAQQETRDE